MSYTDAQVWGIIVALGIGTYLIRLSFIGLAGRVPVPQWLLRYLRYAPVAVIPALIAPLAIWPASTGGTPDPARLLAIAATLGVGHLTKNMVFAILAGLAVLYGGLALLG